MRHFSFSTFHPPVRSTLSASSARISQLYRGLRRSRVRAAAPPAIERDEDEELAFRDHEMAETQGRLAAALNNMVHALMMLDAERRVVFCNRQMHEMFGFDPDIVRPGTTMDQVIAHSIAVGNFPGRGFEDVSREIERMFVTGKRAAFQRQLPNGRTIAAYWSPIACGGWVCTYEDISVRVSATARATHLASHDPLTGLPNRRKLHEAMLTAWPQTGNGFNLLCLEIDRFQAICDTCGHRAGDVLLQHVAKRLAGCMRGGDLVAHLGGASFALLQFNAAAPEAATSLADRVRETMQPPVTVEGRLVLATVSVGIAAPASAVPGVSPQSGAEEMLRQATLALHRAAADGGGHAQHYAPDMDAAAQTRHQLEHDLRGALAAGQFELHYQPLVSLSQRRVTGFEALLRWRHPERGLVSPGVFIPLAEELGLIAAIGAWALRTACLEATTWPDDVRVAVNLSPLQFAAGNGPALPVIVAQVLAETGLPGYRLELEITESVRLQDNAHTLAMLHSLRDLGAVIALDDFGTGYSSLSYLRCFPFDKLKIDQSFVRELPATGSIAIVRAVIALGASLGMSIVAEGVETSAQLAILAGETCDEIQGYLLSCPQPAAEVARLLREAPERLAA